MKKFNFIHMTYDIIVHAYIHTYIHKYIHRFLLPQAGLLLEVSPLDISLINKVTLKLGPITTHLSSMLLMLKCPTL